MNAFLYSVNQNACIADQWDFGFLKDILDNNGFEQTILYNHLPKRDRAVVVIPARHNAEYIEQINKQLANIDHVVLFLMGDEEADFPIEDIDHPSIHIWVQNPHMGKHDDYHKLGTGYPQHMHEYMNEREKTVDIFFAGQITHDRRAELQRVLDDMIQRKRSVEFMPTQGFTQGLPKADYYNNMLEARIAPAPSGAVIPDSFRLFEALECMTIPVADQKTPSGEVMEYWDWLFGTEVPFPQVQDWDRLLVIHQELIDDYFAKLHKIVAWYIKYKRDVKNKILEQYAG